MAKKKDKVMKDNTEQIDEDQHDTNVSSIAMKPSNKMEAMAQAVNLIGLMSPEDLNNFMDAIKQMQGGTASDQIPDDAAARNAGGLQMKPSAAGVIQGTNIGVSEAIQDIFGDDESLTDEFREKTETLFEAAVSARLAILKEEIEQTAISELNEAIETLTENFDQYVTYVAETWMKENQVAIEGALKLEITEGLLADMKDVFERHNVTVPEDKVDVLEAMAERMNEMESRLNSAMEENIALKNENTDYQKEQALGAVSENLTMTQVEKLRVMTEGIEFVDPESYQNKLSIVKAQHFGDKKKVHSQSNILSEEIETDNEHPKPVTNEMKAYLTAATRLSARK